MPGALGEVTFLQFGPHGVDIVVGMAPIFAALETVIQQSDMDIGRRGEQEERGQRVVFGSQLGHRSPDYFQKSNMIHVEGLACFVFLISRCTLEAVHVLAEPMHVVL